MTRTFRERKLLGYWKKNVVDFSPTGIASLSLSLFLSLSLSLFDVNQRHAERCRIDPKVRFRTASIEHTRTSLDSSKRAYLFLTYESSDRVIGSSHREVCPVRQDKQMMEINAQGSRREGKKHAHALSATYPNLFIGGS